MKYFFIAIFAMLSLFVQAADPITPPTVVEAAFAKKFPKNLKVNWEQGTNNTYEAHFITAKKETTATFSADGEWLSTASRVSVAALPKSVIASFRKKVGSKKRLPKMAFKVESPNKGTYYDIKYHHIGISNREIFYNQRGREVSREVAQ
jgi:hypothetical protein